MADWTIRRASSDSPHGTMVYHPWKQVIHGMVLAALFLNKLFLNKGTNDLQRILIGRWIVYGNNLAPNNPALVIPFYYYLESMSEHYNILMSEFSLLMCNERCVIPTIPVLKLFHITWIIVFIYILFLMFVVVWLIKVDLELWNLLEGRNVSLIGPKNI